jgi:hypothetical protein
MTEEEVMATKSDLYLANGVFGDLNVYLRDEGTSNDWLASRACNINALVTG